MLELEHHIKISKETVDDPNLCSRFTEDDLKKIGGLCYESFERDQQSREGWLKRMEAGLNLALQVQEDKSFPWHGCSNVKFPLVTIAAMQFHARAYPEIINGRSVVQARVVGPDLEGIASAAAERISHHMSWQLLEQQQEWEEDEDRGLLNLAIIGCAFKKSFYDAGRGHNVSEFVMAKDLVLDYWAKSVETARVKTHCIPMYRNEVIERCRRKTFRDIEDDDEYNWLHTDATVRFDSTRSITDQRTGIRNPAVSNLDAPYTILEQHCWLDLDDDGYEEPYIVTLEYSSQCVLRIVSRINRIEDVELDDKKRIVRITANEMFTKRSFIPNPDGSLMDIGFGMLLGPLNESVNSAINQIFDAGTISNTSGGFLGRGAKIRGGIYEFSPFSWNRVDSSGDDLRKNLVPLPVREPSSVMFNLLNLLIDYTNRISGSTDALSGINPGQNTPAETARSMVEQGQKIYSAIFKRVWRSMKEEFKKLYVLNSIYLPDNYRFGADGAAVSRDDYRSGMAAVVPAADPMIASEAARFAQARMLKEAAASSAGYDPDAVERRYLRALLIDNPGEVYKGVVGKEQPIDVRIQVAQLKMQGQQLQLQQQGMQFAAQLQETMRLNNAKIMEFQAKAYQLMEEGKAETEKNRINAFNAAANVLKESNAALSDQISSILQGMTDERANQGTAGSLLSLEGPGNNTADVQMANAEAGVIEGEVGSGGIDSGI